MADDDLDMDALLDSCLAELDDTPKTPARTSTHAEDLINRAAAAAVSSAPEGGGEGAEDELQKLTSLFSDLLRESGMEGIDGLGASLGEGGEAGGAPSLPDLGRLDSMLKDFEEDPNVDQFIEGFAQKLMSKDILYEPMKSMVTSYDAYLQEKGPALPASERQRVSQQREYAATIVLVFQETPDDTKRVFELVQLMEATGNPPPELSSCMFPGMNLSPSGCPDLFNMASLGSLFSALGPLSPQANPQP